MEVFTSILLAGIIGLLVVTVSSAGRNKPAPLPPGPPGLPFLGNLHQLTKAKGGRQRQFYKDLHAKYGPIVALRAGPFRTIISIADGKIADELMNKRGAVYGGRPHLHIMDIVGKHRFAMMTYNAEWRARASPYSPLNESHTEKFHTFQEYENLQFLNRMLHAPEKYREWTKLFSLSVILSVLYGMRIDDLESPVTKALQKTADNLANLLLPGRFLVDSFPFIRHLPDFFNSWRAKGRAYYEDAIGFWIPFWEVCKENIETGKTPHTFGGALLKHQKEDPEKWTDLRIGYGLMGSLVFAGADTTAIWTTVFYVIAGLHTECVKKAQAELDEVVGPNRLPTWEDEPSLPYVHAFIKECHRWQGIAPFALPHATTQDDVYNGYHIPAGSVISAQVHIINRDPAHYSSPDTFDPTRFLNHTLSASASATQSDPMKRDHFSYGFGRRMCPGIHVAEASLFLQVSRLLWGFDIARPVWKKTGKAVKDFAEFDIFVSYSAAAAEIDTKISSRGPAYAQVMEEEAANARTELGKIHAETQPESTQ
ncbi:cytochrome P450 [Saitoella complicata NRRL Y-17804]|uniref:cytochrome P450 n=1 Tax=Saitoella complicata (strain BCRC 22490 / CBS 7301 / JCM 7358 / NBRC 10748 / NRRL Y-17804) TaxID=698492 RepID=UPI0008669785|nr:cytochrome P450 [Saitoella complicata NRRL Y-17804]ODQ50983.1 cytochrome P450 [Saitoella complicata NRRL Y-17804]